MIIRHPKLNDLNEITDIESKCFPILEAASKESFKQRIENYFETFYLLEDSCIIAFINGMYSSCRELKDEMYHDLSLYDPHGQYLMIFGVDTLPQYQHHGYASKLMNYVIEDSKKKGIKEVVLTCKTHMISFYEQFGYINEGLSDSTHGNEKWYSMRLILKNENAS